MTTGRSIAVAIANRQRCLALDRPLLRRAVRQVLRDSTFDSAEISLAIVDDPTMARLNEQYLQHVGPTDVLSFVLDTANNCLEGELVVDAEEAIRKAPQYGWPAEQELLLYVIHGTLHLMGYDDASAADRRKMRAGERRVLAELGVPMKRSNS